MVDAVNATVGSATANSYATEDEAAAFIGVHVDSLTSNVWSNATADGKKIVLQMATRLLDEWVDWEGYKATDAQALRWPRYGVYSVDKYLIDSNVIPQFLVNATCEMARILLTSGDTTANPDTLGFSRLQVGSLELEIDKSDRDRFGSIPDSVRVIVEPYGDIRSRSGTGAVKLART